ncbi:MAG: hypothetical protein ACOYOB_17920, partial [Myxococcota bacterium]
EHSIAGLIKFKKKLEENASDFILLPLDEGGGTLEDVAYDLLYDGSVNKFRSVQGLAENRFELSKHLSKQTLLHLATESGPAPHDTAGISKFFRGSCAIEYFELWESVLTYFEVLGDSQAARLFVRRVAQELGRIEYDGDPRITTELKRGLELHLAWSVAMARALIEPGGGHPDDGDSVTVALTKLLRDANLLRHHYVCTPLLNYTSYNSSFTSFRPEAAQTFDPEKISRSPRFVNFDECCLAVSWLPAARDGDEPIAAAKALYERFNRQEMDGIHCELGIREEDEP